MADLVVWARGLSVQQRRGSAGNVLSDIQIELRSGERLALAGPNGAGKTSLLLALVGALPVEGELTVLGRNLASAALADLRRNLGLVFAEPDTQLFCETVHGEVAFGPMQQGLATHEVENRTREAMLATDTQNLADRNPLALSLGEQRRVAIAAMLACRPRLLLIDEPTASLDPVARRQILAVLDRFDQTLIIATHDLTAAAVLDARLMLLREGRVMGTGPARSVIEDQSLLERAGMWADD